MTDSEYLSADDLRSRLYHKLRENGIVDSLKSQLRNKLVTELKHVGGEQSFKPEPLYSDGGSLLHRAANALVADHLRHCHYDYCLSIFLPESGSAQDKLFTTRDLLQLLNISPHSKLHKSLASTASGQHKKGFLWQLLCEVASACGHAAQTVSVQTDPIQLPLGSSLEDELRKVEELYTAGDVSQKRMAIEERILSYQRALDERASSDLKLETARFKEGELARMRLEERERCRREIEQITRDMERTYQSKVDALTERERHSTERLNMQQEIGDKESYSQRQTLLDDIEALKNREHDTRRREDNIDRERQIWDQKMSAREQLVRQREDKVRQVEIEYEQRLHADTSKFKLEEQSRYMDRVKGLEVREARVQEDERRLDTELRSITQVKAELQEKRQHVNELEAELTRNRHDLISVTQRAEVLGEKMREMVDYQIMKEENAVLKRELDTTKTRLAEVTRDNIVERQKQEQLLRDMAAHASQPPPELCLRDQQLHKLRSEQQQQQAVHSHQRALLERQLQTEAGRTQQLLRQQEEQRLQQKEMSREIADLRQQLYGTRQALTNEVYRKPHSPVSGDGSLCDAGDRYEYGGAPPSAALQGTAECSSPDFRHILGDVPSMANTDDLSVSLDLVEETKRRLQSLEREAQNLETNYQDFQLRMTSGVLQPAPSGKAGSHSSHLPATPAQQSGSHARSRLNISNPLSSTPARPSRHSHISKEALSVHDYDPMLNMSVSTVRSSPPPADECRLESRPLQVADLEARPSSPSVVVMAASSSSASQGQASRTAAEPGLPAPVTSLDSNWQTKQDATTSARLREEEEDREREERRRQRVEKRRHEEEEAWEQQQRELQALQGAGPRAQEMRAPATEPEQEPEKEPETGIDPLMQKYMNMVQKQKSKEKQSADKTPPASAQELSTADDDYDDKSEPVGKAPGSEEDFW